MPKVPRGRRIRSYQPKTTTGCLLCKERRVKCDEGKPACLKCTSAGRRCTGYNTQMIRSSITDKVSIIAGPSSEIHVSTQAHRSFSFFVQLTSPQLAGFFGSDFWERLVLQSAYHEPAVRHAVVAVGAIHQGFSSEANRQSNLKAFALGEYNLAIKHLLSLSENEPRRVNVWLITCILFICFENMQSCHSSAGTHLRSGAKLLHETSNIRQNRIVHQRNSHHQNKPVVYTSPEIIARLFSALDSQSNLAIDRDVFMLQEKASTGATYKETPLVFSSIEEAKNTFEYGRCLFMQAQRTQQSSAPSQSAANLESHVDRCTNLLSHFSLALQNMVKSRGSLLTQKEEIAIAVLQLHILHAHISLLVEFQTPETSIQWQETMVSRWESIAPLMEEMLLLGKKIILSTLSSENIYKGNTIFCLDMGIIIPMYTIATQSQDFLLRREAIALLRTTIRQEGLWNSLLAARAAERIMEIEEMIWKETSTTAYSPTPTSTQVPRPLFELDATGGRLQYFRRTTAGNEALVRVTEEMFTW